MARALEHALSGATGWAVVEGRLRLPTELYGRSSELATLAAALERTEARSGVVLLRGYAGAGKTALVEESRRRLAHRGILFVDGKFDQLHRGAPYASLIQALRKLMRFIASRDQASVVAWRERLGDLPVEMSEVLAELVPELADMLDSGGHGPSGTPPVEARNRFHDAIRRLLHAVARPDRPLVVFLDDLQWADGPTLELLPRLVGGPDDRHVLLIGSYRSNEVEARHPLSVVVEELRDSETPLDEVEVGPLDEDAVLAMIHAALGPGDGRVRLAVLCHERTRGNPFFLRHFLESMHDEGTLAFDSGSGGWSYDPEAARARPTTADVVTFIAAELRDLPEGALACLKSASCVGPDFDLATLAHLLGTDRRAVLERLRPALTHDLVVPVSDEHWAPAHIGFQRIRFRFAHDRVQQAARSLCTPFEVAASHRKMAELLLEHTDDRERETRLFELVEHLNRSVDLQPALVTDPAQLQDLNLSAARRATRAAAFEPADEYYRKALALFDERQWEDDYERARALHVEAARSAGLNGDVGVMDKLVRVAVEHARTTLDVVLAREVSLHGLMRDQKLGEAVALGMELLAELGRPLPDPSAVESEVGAIVAMLGELDILELERATAPEVLVAQRIRQGIMSAAYLSMPEIFPLLPCALVRSTEADGVTDQSAYGFAVFGMVLNALGLIDLSFEAAKMARALLAKTEDRSTLAKTRHILNGHVEPFVVPLRDTVEPERDVYRLGMDTGDLEYAAWALHIMVAHGFYAGSRLGPLREMDRRNEALLEQIRQLPASSCSQPFSQAIRNCIGEDVVTSSRLIRPGYHEDEQMDHLVGVGFRGAVYILTVLRTFVRYLFRDIPGAVLAADAGAEYADGATATYHQVWWHQFRALAILAERGPGGLDEARVSLVRLELWCASSEANHRHRVEMVAAEIARVESRDGDALRGYDAAIGHAREQGFLHEEGLANELAARFYLERGSEPAARGYLAEARQAYETWGAWAKVEQLDEELGHVFRRSARPR